MIDFRSTADEVIASGTDVAILPIGSTEQHGPHLPLCTDFLIAEKLCEKLAEKTGYYLLPVNNKVSKDYSDGDMVYSKTMNDWRVHDGIDVSGNNGDNVIAVQDGKVVDVQTDELWGDVVTIQHGNGLTAKYCGVKATVNKDDSIEQGQVIGTLVAIPIEATDGMHLHLEITVDGKTVDPIKALNLLSEAPENTTEQ